MVRQQVKINRAEELLGFEWKLLMSINESSRRITTSLFSYFISLNLAIYGGFAWVKVNTSINGDWKWILPVLLGVALLIFNISIFQIYLRNYLYANDNWKQVKIIRDYLSGNKEPKWRIEEFKNNHNDSYNGITHKTFVFILSLFTAISVVLPFFFGLFRTQIPLFDEMYILLVVIAIICFFALFINAQNKNPFLFWMKD